MSPKAKIITILVILSPLFSSAQRIKTVSKTLDIELPAGSTFETRPALIKRYNLMLDSFAAIKGYKLGKEDVEIIYTSDSLKSMLAKLKFTVTREGSSDFYKVTKDNNKFLVYSTPGSLAGKPGSSSASLQLALILTYLKAAEKFGVSTTILIKRIR